MSPIPTELIRHSKTSRGGRSEQGASYSASQAARGGVFVKL